MTRTTIRRAAPRIETERLVLRVPEMDDAPAIFERYSSDEEVTRLLGWPRHRKLGDAKAFCAWSISEWARWAAGPYLICDHDGDVLGSSGFGFESARCAATGYVLAKDAWGRGLATETLEQMVKIAGEVGLVRLYALCHPDNPASYRVLEKCDFEREGLLRRYMELPNLEPGKLSDVLCYSRIYD